MDFAATVAIRILMVRMLTQSGCSDILAVGVRFGMKDYMERGKKWRGGERRLALTPCEGVRGSHTSSATLHSFLQSNVHLLSL